MLGNHISLSVIEVRELNRTQFFIIFRVLTYDYIYSSITRQAIFNI
jgi:hypothetical protein